MDTKSYNTFFDYLRRKQLSTKKILGTLAKWEYKNIFDFTAEARTLLPFIVDKPESQFGFIANSPLSGAPFPCFRLECRLQHVDSLARFSALYGDLVAIQDPFRAYESFNFPDIDSARIRLHDDLFILYHLRPLLEAGLVGIAEARYFCEEHAPAMLKKSALKRAVDSLHTEYLRNVNIYAGKMLDDLVIHCKGPERLIEHGSSIIMVPSSAGLSLRRKKDSRGHHQVIGKGKEYVIGRFIQEILDDVIQLGVYSSLYRLNYLTDREVDINAIEATNTDEVKRFSCALSKGLSHSLPFVQKVSIEKLLKLRQEEGESFQVYRDALSSTLNNLNASDAGKMRQAFNDMVLPELHKIDLTMKNARKLLHESIRGNIIFSSGLVTIGIASGLLIPEAGKILSAIGGIKFGMDVLQTINQLLKEPASIIDNKFYFLWKVRQQAQKSG